MPEAACTLHVVRAGLHTTVQDEGRWGYQHLGVPVGGALDLGALRRANVVVGNAPGEAALEVTLTGCTIRAAADVTVAVTGARFVLRANEVPAAMDTAILLRAGMTLDLVRRDAGARAYVAVRGGVDAPLVLGSRSAWPLWPRRGALRDGDVLVVGSRAIGDGRTRPLAAPEYRDLLRVVPGPDAGEDGAVMDVLCAASYRIAAAASRMAYPLEDGPAVPLDVPTRPSSGTVTGAVQVLPSGMPVLLMAERQTTGGYPVAAVVIAADLSHAAQLAPGDRVRFEPCTRADALQALMRDEAARERA